MAFDTNLISVPVDYALNAMVENYRITHHFNTRSEATAALIKKGLAAVETEKKDTAARR